MASLSNYRTPSPYRMDSHKVIKVADFGLSVAIAEDKNYFKPIGGAEEKLPVKWMAPESLQMRRFSEMSDVVGVGLGSIILRV